MNIQCFVPDRESRDSDERHILRKRLIQPERRAYTWSDHALEGIWISQPASRYQAKIVIYALMAVAGSLR